MSSTNRGAIRKPMDFYATPETAFKPLLPYLPKNMKYWEPSCGDGRLIKWLNEYGCEADGTDLSLGKDFLKDTKKRSFIITNPPFSLAQEFCDHALNLSPEVIMLLRVNFLGSQKRKVWWQTHEPSALFVLSKRPDFTGGGGDSCEYAWYYWGKRFTGIKHI